MECFVKLKKLLRFVGVLPFVSNNHRQILKILINCVFYALCLILFLSTFWFFSFESKTFNEFVECLYFLTSSLLLTSWYSVYLWQSEKYSQLFSNLEDIIHQSRKKITCNMYWTNCNNFLLMNIFWGTRNFQFICQWIVQEH